MKLLMLLLALNLLVACTSEQAYNSGQAWQANQCSRSPDSSERERCATQPRTTYDDYKSQK
ncbi:MAG TPA: hypothetical protein VJM53_05270 [Burkholderiales bacterium]|jgi:hypothetical protein|nr:hypothetical protein [Burkholderiales bacterium]